MKALYQKYRPQTFAQVVGQQYVKQILLNSLKSDRVAHAYLFTGPRGTGKTSTARLLAKAINCTNPGKDGDACGKCDVCLAVEQGSFMDLIEIDAASNRGIDEIRQLRERVNFAPSQAKRKIYIIDEVHMLTKEAFNALLKTLEEPPEYVTFILATTEAHKVPMTILSRVQRYDFKLASKEEIIEKLKKITKSEDIKVEDAALEKIYELGGGSFRDSESLLAKIINIESKKDKSIEVEDVNNAAGLISDKDIKKYVELIMAGEPKPILDRTEEFTKQGYSVDQLVYQSIQELRGMLLDYYDKKTNLDLARAFRVIKELSEVPHKLKDAPIPTLALEIAIYALSSEAKTPQALTSTKAEVPPPPKQVNQVINQPKKETSKEKKVEALPQDTEVTITIEEVNEKWPAILEKTRTFNHHLYAFLSKAKLGGIEGNTIKLEVAYKFHKQKIESLKSREFITKMFTETLGFALLANCIVNPELITSQEEEEKDNSNEKLVEEIFGDI